MEPEGSLPHSQASATCPCPGPAQSSPHTHILEIHPNIIQPSTPRSPQWSLSLRFPHQDPIRPLSATIRATCPAHLILLDFITRTINISYTEDIIFTEYSYSRSSGTWHNSSIWIRSTWIENRTMCLQKVRLSPHNLTRMQNRRT